MGSFELVASIHKTFGNGDLVVLKQSDWDAMSTLIKAALPAQDYERLKGLGIDLLPISLNGPTS